MAAAAPAGDDALPKTDEPPAAEGVSTDEEGAAAAGAQAAASASGAATTELSARDVVDLDDKCVVSACSARSRRQRSHGLLAGRARGCGPGALHSYQLVLSVVRLLQSQEQQARRDLVRLIAMRRAALADPAAYVDQVLANVRTHTPRGL